MQVAETEASQEADAVGVQQVAMKQVLAEAEHQVAGHGGEDDGHGAGRDLRVPRRRKEQSDQRERCQRVQGNEDREQRERKGIARAALK